MKKKGNIISFNSYKRRRGGKAGAQSGSFEGFEDSSQEAVKLKDPNERDWHGRTALHRAAETGDKGLAEKLVGAGADPNIKDKNDETPLYCVFRYVSDRETSRGRLSDEDDILSGEIVQTLIEAGAEAGAEDQKGYSPLHFAALSGGARAAQALIEAGAKLDAKAKDGKTPIDCAEETNQAEILRIFREAGGAASAKSPLEGSAAAGPAQEIEKTADSKAPGPPPPNIIFMSGRQKQNSAPSGGADALPASRPKDDSAELPKVIYMKEYLQRKKPPEWNPFPEENIPEDAVPPRRSWGWQASAAVSAAAMAVLILTALPLLRENSAPRGIASKQTPKLSSPPPSLTIGRHPSPEESREFELLDQTARSPQSLNRRKAISPSEYAKLLGGRRLLRGAAGPPAPAPKDSSFK